MTFILAKPPAELPLPFLTVCEGWGDAQFFDRLLHFAGINNCSIGCPSRDVCKEQEGANDLQRYLGAIKFLYRKQNPPVLRGILLVVDADTSIPDQFTHAAEALTFAEFPTPADPYTILEDGQANLRAAICLMPGRNRTGTLEHILLQAAYGKTPALQQCVDRFAECTGVVATATDNQSAKMKMSMLVGACCKGNPWASVALMWEDPGNPVPIDSPAFLPLIEFLRQFTTS